MTSPPEGICVNCFAAWRARKPRPLAVHCWHGRTVAWPKGDGWHVERAFDSLLERLRQDDSL